MAHRKLQTGKTDVQDVLTQRDWILHRIQKLSDALASWVEADKSILAELKKSPEKSYYSGAAQGLVKGRIDATETVLKELSTQFTGTTRAEMRRELDGDPQ